MALILLHQLTDEKSRILGPDLVTPQKRMDALLMTKPVTRLAISAAAVGVLAISATPTEAATLGFNCLTQNSAASCAIGQSQLTAELTDLGNGTVEFLFSNSGPGAASVSQIYFDQPTPSILSLAASSGSNGVAFRQTPPSNLPGSQGIAFRSPSGLNQGDWLRLAFTLSQGSTFASLLTSLSTGDLRVGMHVQQIGAFGHSETFVHEQVVPEPTTMLLLGTGLAAVAARRRRRQTAQASNA